MKDFGVADIAKVCHEINRDYCRALGDFSQVPWEEAPDWQKESAINGVFMHLDNPDAGPEQSHINWMEEKIRDGWVFGTTKNEHQKTHPCLVPFAQLPQEQQAKDFIFRSIVHQLKKFI